MIMETERDKAKQKPKHFTRFLRYYLSLQIIVVIIAVVKLPSFFLPLGDSTTAGLVNILSGLGLLVFLIAYGFSIYGFWTLHKWGYWGLMGLGVVALIVSFLMQNFTNTAAALGHLFFLFFLTRRIEGLLITDDKITSIVSDIRFIRAVLQIVFAFVVVIALALLWSSIFNTLQSRNLLPSFGFLDRRSGIPINESPEWYTTNSTFWQAFVVGVLNTLRVVSIGLVGATVMGILLGIFLLSSNWLVRSVSRGYVEILRNTPLLVQLIFWYFVVLLGLPADDIVIPNEGVFILSLRYIVYAAMLVGLWLYNMRFALPSRTLSGALIGLIVLEIAFLLFGTSAIIITILAVLGALAFAAAYAGQIPKKHSGWAHGVGVIAISQFVGHIVFDVLFKFGLLPHPQVVFDEVFPAIFLGRTGIVFPEVVLTVNFVPFGIALVIGLIAAFILYHQLGALSERTGHAIPRTFYALLLLVGFCITGWVFANRQPLPAEVTVGEGEEARVVLLAEAREEELLDDSELRRYHTEPVRLVLPERNRFKRVLAGSEVTLNYAGLLLGLVVYTSAFIGEIVRAGIQAVPHGQTEAARALGLTQAQTLRMIVLPQALRVSSPPLGNQYLNLAKNSSLAAAIAYSDTYQVGTIMMNQSGQSITGFTLVLLTYLGMSLIISAFMNFVNSRFQLVQR